MSEDSAEFFDEEVETPFITLITAPVIPTSEKDALKRHWQESMRDSDYAVVLNYEARIDFVELPDNSQVLIMAPGIPVDEIRKLKEDFDAARNAYDPLERVLICNYEVRIDVFEPSEIKSYGSYGEDVDDEDASEEI